MDWLWSSCSGFCFLSCCFCCCCCCDWRLALVIWLLLTMLLSLIISLLLLLSSELFVLKLNIATRSSKKFLNLFTVVHHKLILQCRLREGWGYCFIAFVDLCTTNICQQKKQGNNMIILEKMCWKAAWNHFHTLLEVATFVWTCWFWNPLLMFSHWYSLVLGTQSSVRFSVPWMRRNK